MSTILKAENISKQYRLGTVGSGTLGDDLKRWWYGIRGKEDPFLQVGAVNDRSSVANEDYVWALRDINFEVKQGEVLGIIGKNGAGKSTLLKLLSRVTAPTTGSIKTRGRIASLLEVGTGFHGELTGRENIFMNGAVLGMTKTEIKNKLDEIIAFSGCEKYIDTPVKRYSSGMTVRLGFAVAAHLEPEILVVDEVLAVGDAEFQKKAIGKMNSLSKGEGRTVLFVSHNMASVKSLCTKTIVLENGTVVFEGDSSEGIDHYLQLNKNSGFVGEYSKHVEESGIQSLQLLDKGNNNRAEFSFDETISINSKIKIKQKHLNAHLGFRVIDKNEKIIFSSEIKLSDKIENEGHHAFKVEIPASLLVPGFYTLSFALHQPNIKVLDYLENCLSFHIVETGSDFHIYQGQDFGCIFVDCSWKKINTTN
ncbi:ABC transporter ATP-binding protein [Gramella sp. AN32]|uniref:ABC transporter ATP-binding protein n=1 Tax=Christiangramia antarctica TaxID=2058158 RepID=A0ABW5X737_9FLAO|nr:ABC transporter ATP-binding protein [Gramella sp. AN32]MCM4154708.1 ABC transporter ATP-binding protein [Gramella sp. AN32]